jgi:hypothetical protein
MRIEDKEKPAYLLGYAYCTPLMTLPSHPILMQWCEWQIANGLALY